MTKPQNNDINPLMSNHEGPPRLGWLRVGLPNETPEDQIEESARRVAEYFLEGVQVKPGDFIAVGTIVELSLSITGIRDLRPREELTPEELAERIRMEDAYHEFEPDEELK